MTKGMLLFTPWAHTLRGFRVKGLRFRADGFGTSPITKEK